MTLNQLVSRAASVYPEAYVMKYWNPQAQEPRDNPVGGDTLAEFVARELADTYDPEAGDEEQVDAAVRAMQSAAEELSMVARALGELAGVRRAA